MLNEIGEYEHYSMSPQEIAACEYPRLKYFTLIKREFSGLERAMTIVARHFLFDTSEETPDLSESKINELRELLKAWCGFKTEARTERPTHFDGWLVSYIRRAFLDERIQLCRNNLPVIDSAESRVALSNLLEKISSWQSVGELGEVLSDFESFRSAHGKTLKKFGYEPTQIAALLKTLIKLADKNKNFSKSLFGSLTAKGEIPFRAITYDRIIANALLAGKLRRYYLTCDEELFRTKKILKGSKKLSAADSDMVLKMTAEYLLNRRHSSQEFTETNDSNIMNWLVGSRKPENFDRDSYVLAENGEQVFEMSKVNLGGINALKFKLHPQWTKHFALVEDDDRCAELGRIFFSDAGSSEPLRKNIKYS